MGYTGSVRTVRRYVSSLDVQRSHKRKTVRFETPPGKQAQADWACCGRFPDANGTMVPVYVISIRGDSFRLEEKRQAGRPPSQPKGDPS